MAHGPNAALSWISVAYELISKYQFSDSFIGVGKLSHPSPTGQPTQTVEPILILKLQI